MNTLTHKLIQNHVIKTDSVIDAFANVNRADFMLPDTADQADADVPFPIGFGQTISQPSTVGFMLEKLEAKKGDKVLDVGSGSGWTVALLAHIVGPEGKVFGIERIPQLVEFAVNNLKNYDFKNWQIKAGQGAEGWEEEAPFDRIIVAAAAKEIPPVFKDQLKIGGKLVIPLADNTIRVLTKKSEKDFDEEINPGFVFVPFIQK